MSSLVASGLARGLNPHKPPDTPKLSLHEFVRGAWHVVEPATEFVDGRHIHAICEHLEAVSAGQIRNLLINLPPRHAKSLIVSVFWPAWEWTLAPWLRWLYASYGIDLSERDSVKCRRVLDSAWYQRHWGSLFRLTTDQNVKRRYENTRSGYRVATSVDGVGTGEGGDRIVADDPHNVRESESDTRRQNVIDWWDNTISTRGNDPKTVTRVIVMQRVHQEDLSGHVLAKGGWEHLCLPARYEPAWPGTSLPWHDWRMEPGELLWPERFDEPALQRLEDDLAGSASGQLQQRPQPREGNLFKREWWQRYTALPKIATAGIFVDSSFKTGVSNDYTAMALWGATGQGDYYLIDFWRGRVEYPELMQTVHDFHAQHRQQFTVLPVVIEDKASGQSAIQSLSRPYPIVGDVLPALPVLPFPLRDKSEAAQREQQIAKLAKFARAEGVTGIVQSGHAHLPADAPWVQEFIDQHADFPSGAHDDDVDTTSMALVRLSVPQPKPQTYVAGGSRNLYPVPIR